MATATSNQVYPYQVSTENQEQKVGPVKSKLDVVSFRKWTPEELTEYFLANGVPVSDCLLVHKISGDFLDDLSDDDYNNMGFACIGDKITVQKAVLKLINQPKHFPSYFKYLQHRWEISNVRKFYRGEELSLSEADNVVNSLALVNALILTIPFGVITAFSIDYWDSLYINTQVCPRFSFDSLRNNIIDNGYATAYSSMTSLVICIFYFILRPKEYLFSEWWRRVRWSLVFILFGSISSIINMLTLYGTISSTYAFRSGELCESYDNNNPKYATGVAIIVAFSVGSIILMA